ncbi:BnaA08g13160D [Brassica napus]|uniref:BnaA08g13160D protein n=1 Tax=Brassica napus TaxID=3708 RepID=A0A078FIC1_BRANA|nr:BnaA08g13160D [Brassica napus]
MSLEDIKNETVDLDFVFNLV